MGVINLDSEVSLIIVILGLLFSSIYTVILGVYIGVKAKKSSVRNWFLLGLTLVGIWTTFHIFELLAPGPDERWHMVSIQYIAICYFSPSFYMFSRSYSRFKKYDWNRKLFVFSIPTLFYISILTNPYHHLFYYYFGMDGEKYGPLCWGLIVVTGIYLFIGVRKFTAEVSYRSVYRKKQLSYFGYAMSVPMISHGLIAFGIVKADFNITLITFPFALTMITLAVLKYQFLDILPITVSQAVENIDDGFLVINQNGHIEDYNKTFFNQFMIIEKCKTFNDFLEELSELINNRAILENLKYSLNVKKENYVSGSMNLEHEEVLKNIQYTTKAITDIYGDKIATIITFHDITEMQMLYKEHEEKKVELMLAKKQLEEHMGAVQRLTIENERNRLMSTVHDTLGHSMAELLALLEKCDIILKNEDISTEEAITTVEDTLVTARGGLAQIRQSVSEFRKMGVEL